MFKVIIIIAASIVLHPAPVFSQHDSTRYIFGLPGAGDDTSMGYMKASGMRFYMLLWMYAIARYARN